MDEEEMKAYTQKSPICFLFAAVSSPEKHHVYWPGNMSCCVKSSVLRRLAEQKGQKSMLIKGCGQLLACGFALIKAKCSCSQKTLQIYLSNSAHWLWVRPVGFVASRALTKKSQHFLQRYEVCIYARVCVCVHTCCAGCPCGHSVPRAVFSPDFVRNMWHEATHLQVMVLSHWCCALHSPRGQCMVSRFILSLHRTLW